MPTSKPICECGGCRVCKGREANRRWRQRNPERVKELKDKQNAARRAYAKEWRDKNRDKLDAATKRYRERNPEYSDAARLYRQNNPEKVAAHYATRDAIRGGELKRQPCEVCGKTRVHAHHDDYEKPLDVRWLCASHHSQVHRAS